MILPKRKKGADIIKLKAEIKPNKSTLINMVFLLMKPALAEPALK